MANTESELLAILAVLREERRALNQRIADRERELQGVCQHIIAPHWIAGNGRYCTRCKATFASDDDQTEPV